MITVNGQEVEHEEGTNVASLLAKLNYILPQIVVRLNGKLIARTAYEETAVNDGDVMDAIHPMVGG
ncbi:MAG: sulfur carrier protein ThiS [Proteobacteria bacterium]|nr:sulfur carrier protein ThiS [Pseudomonadota bacterium]